MNAEQVAARFGCTVAQAKAQYAKNAQQMRACARYAGNRTYRGMTAAQWNERAAKFEEKAK